MSTKDMATIRKVLYQHTKETNMLLLNNADLLNCTVEI